jgi:hypothetical protein
MFSELFGMPALEVFEFLNDLGIVVYTGQIKKMFPISIVYYSSLT